MGIAWENSFAAFVTLTLVLGGAGAWMTGRAVARGWRPLSRALLYMVLLGLALRFFHYALANGSLLSLQFYLVDTAVLALTAALSWRLTRTFQMVTQYPWHYRRTSPFTWAERKPAEDRA